MDQTAIDLITGGPNGLQANGNVAARLLQSGFNINALRPNSTLRKDEWILMDNAVVEIARERMPFTSLLLSRGLRYDIPEALGVTRLEWERMGDMGPAYVDMAGVTEGRGDRVEFDLQSMPIPIVHKEFNINIRALAASRRSGMPLDTVQASLSSRIVSETIEGIVFNGSTIAGTNGTIYGLLTAPNRSTGSVTNTGRGGWDATATTGENILSDVLAMVTAAVGKHMYGPYALIVTYTTFLKLGQDFKTNSDKTIMSRILELPMITDIIPSQRLTGTNVLLVQMTSDVIQMVVGFGPTPIQWESHGGMVTNFKVMSIMVPRIRDDSASQSGIVHYS